MAWARDRTAPLHYRSSYPAKAGYPVFQSFREPSSALWNTGSPAFADDDGSRYCATAANQNRSRSVEELKRVNRRRSLADLEVELRRPHLPGLTRLGTDLAALDRVTALHHQFTRMGICGDVTVGVPNQNQIAITLELIAGIGDDAVLRRLHWRTFGDRQIDTVVRLAIGLGAVGRYHLAAYRPAERRQRAGGLGGLDRRGDGSVFDRRGGLGE